MTPRPLKFNNLKKALTENKIFLKKIKKAKNNKELRTLISQAPAHQIFLMGSLIRAHLCPNQKIKICQKDFKHILKAKKLKHIKSHFGPSVRVEPLDQTRQAVLKSIPVLKIFVHSVI